MGGLGINNVKGCFDRIIHTVIILVIMSFGLCPSHTRLVLEILQVAEHRIKSGFGVSEPVYGIADDREPLQGCGQDNGLGPTTWSLISSKMIEVMRKRGNSVYL